MVKFDEQLVSKESSFSINCNIILSGSKRLRQEQKEEAMTVRAVRILIVDVDDETNVLVDEEAPAKLFSPDGKGQRSCGYGLNSRGFKFTKVGS